MWLYILVFTISCLVLVKAGTEAVKLLARIAQFLKWSEFMVAFVLMAFITSLPELFVGITSALHHQAQLSFGNIIGSNIINLTLAVALPLFAIKNLKTETALIKRSSIYTAIIVSLPILLMLDGTISRIDGVILLFALLVYFWDLLEEKKRFSKAFSNNIKRDYPAFKLFLKDFAWFLVAVFFLLLSAEGIVWSSSALALGTGLSLVAVGIMLVALGTNLPEIIFSLRAVSLKHHDMVLGNLMGSVVVNSTLVLGITFLIQPMEISSFAPYTIGIVFTLLATLFFVLFSRSGRTISRKEGIFLFLFYLVFIVIQFLLG